MDVPPQAGLQGRRAPWQEFLAASPPCTSPASPPPTPGSRKKGHVGVKKRFAFLFSNLLNSLRSNFLSLGKALGDARHDRTAEQEIFCRLSLKICLFANVHLRNGHYGEEYENTRWRDLMQFLQSDKRPLQSRKRTHFLSSDLLCKKRFILYFGRLKILCSASKIYLVFWKINDPLYANIGDIWKEDKLIVQT